MNALFVFLANRGPFDVSLVSHCSSCGNTCALPVHILSVSALTEGNLDKPSTVVAGSLQVIMLSSPAAEYAATTSVCCVFPTADTPRSNATAVSPRTSPAASQVEWLAVVDVL